MDQKKIMLKIFVAFSLQKKTKIFIRIVERSHFFQNLRKFLRHRRKKTRANQASK